MMKIRKDFSLKIISLLVSISFLFTTTLYAYPDSKDTLRIPIGLDKERSRFALYWAFYDEKVDRKKSPLSKEAALRYLKDKRSDTILVLYKDSMKTEFWPKKRINIDQIKKDEPEILRLNKRFRGRWYVLVITEKAGGELEPTESSNIFVRLLQAFDVVSGQKDPSEMIRQAMQEFLEQGGTLEELETLAAMPNSEIKNELSAMSNVSPVIMENILANLGRIRDYLRAPDFDLEDLLISNLCNPRKCAFIREELLAISKQSSANRLMELMHELFESEHPKELTLKDIGEITYCAFSLIEKTDPQYRNLMEYHLVDWYLSAVDVLSRRVSKGRVSADMSIPFIRQTGAMLMHTVWHISQGAPVSVSEAGMQVTWAAIASDILLAFQHGGIYRGDMMRAQFTSISSGPWPGVIFLDSFDDRDEAADQMMRITELWAEGVKSPHLFVKSLDLNDDKLELDLPLPSTDIWYVFISREGRMRIADPRNQMACDEPPSFAAISVASGLGGQIFYDTIWRRDRPFNDGFLMLSAVHEYFHELVFWLIGHNVSARDFLSAVFDEPLVDYMAQSYERPAHREIGEKGDKLSNLAGSDDLSGLMLMSLRYTAGLEYENDFYNNYYINKEMGMTGEKYLLGQIFFTEVLFPRIAQRMAGEQTRFGETIETEDDVSNVLRAFLRHLRQIRDMEPKGEGIDNYLISYLYHVFPHFSPEDYQECVTYYNEHLLQLVHDFFASRFSEDEYNDSMRAFFDLLLQDPQSQVLVRNLGEVVERSDYTTDFVRVLLAETLVADKQIELSAVVEEVGPAEGNISTTPPLYLGGGRNPGQVIADLEKVGLGTAQPDNEIKMLVGEFGELIKKGKGGLSDYILGLRQRCVEQFQETRPQYVALIDKAIEDITARALLEILEEKAKILEAQARILEDPAEILEEKAGKIYCYISDGDKRLSTSDLPAVGALLRLGWLRFDISWAGEVDLHIDFTLVPVEERKFNIVAFHSDVLKHLFDVSGGFVQKRLDEFKETVKPLLKPNTMLVFIAGLGQKEGLKAMVERLRKELEVDELFIVALEDRFVVNQFDSLLEGKWLPFSDFSQLIYDFSQMTKVSDMIYNRQLIQALATAK